MSRRRPLLTVAIVLTWLTSTADPAPAEWFVDLYGRGGFTESNDATINISVRAL